MNVRVARVCATLAGILLAAGGCTAVEKSDPVAATPAITASVSASPTPTLPPAKPEFLTALAKTTAGPFHFTMQSTLPDRESESGHGAFDKARQVYESTLTHVGGSLAGTHLRIAIGKNHFLRDAKDGRWVHLDMSRVSKDNGLIYFDLTDPIGLGRFASRVVDVARLGPKTYVGSFDPSGITPEFLPLGAPSLWIIGDSAAKFNATVDASGRVNAITISVAVPGKPTMLMKATFTRLGTRLTTKAPSRSQYDEADNMYYGK